MRIKIESNWNGISSILKNIGVEFHPSKIKIKNCYLIQYGVLILTLDKKRYLKRLKEILDLMEDNFIMTHLSKEEGDFVVWHYCEQEQHFVCEHEFFEN